MTTLPKLMVALNGARRSKFDHPNLPVSIEEIINEIEACIAFGADGFHIHVRNTNGGHSLGIEDNRKLLNALEPFQEKTYIQLTTEQAGIYQYEDQIELITTLAPRHLSVAFREIAQINNPAKSTQFYQTAKASALDLQHILYTPDELRAFLRFRDAHFPLEPSPKLLFVLGEYSGRLGQPEEIDSFLKVLNEHDIQSDWAVCAFGQSETECLLASFQHGGKARIGFENSLWHEDGSLAQSNAERVMRFLSGLHF